jgi:hypothetical protein
MNILLKIMEIMDCVIICMEPMSIGKREWQCDGTKTAQQKFNKKIASAVIACFLQAMQRGDAAREHIGGGTTRRQLRRERRRIATEHDNARRRTRASHVVQHGRAGGVRRGARCRGERRRQAERWRCRGDETRVFGAQVADRCEQRATLLSPASFQRRRRVVVGVRCCCCCAECRASAAWRKELTRDRCGSGGHMTLLGIDTRAIAIVVVVVVRCAATSLQLGRESAICSLQRFLFGSQFGQRRQRRFFTRRRFRFDSSQLCIASRVGTKRNKKRVKLTSSNAFVSA